MADFYLLDSRAGMLAVENNGILDTDDNGKYILTVGSLKACCRDANSGDYGEHNVVSDDKYNILWDLFNEHRHWSHKLYKRPD